MIKRMNPYSSMDQRIDSIRVSRSDRQIAKKHMRDADFVADLVCRAAENLRSAEGLLSKLFVQRTESGSPSARQITGRRASGN